MYLAAILQCKLIQGVSVYHLPLQKLNIPLQTLANLWFFVHDNVVFVVWRHSRFILPPLEQVNLAVCTGVNIHRGLESPGTVLDPPHNYTPALEDQQTGKEKSHRSILASFISCRLQSGLLLNPWVRLVKDLTAFLHIWGYFYCTQEVDGLRAYIEPTNKQV